MTKSTSKKASLTKGRASKSSPKPHPQEEVMVHHVIFRFSKAFWMGVLGVLLLLLAYEWRWVLLPFGLGFLVAYALSRQVERLERWGVPRAYGALLVLLAFVLTVGLVISIAVPLIQAEVGLLLRVLPGYLDRLHLEGMNMLGSLLHSVPEADLEHVRLVARTALGDFVRWLGVFLTSLLSSGLALATVFSVSVITPVVAFYLLRDWPALIRVVNKWLPPRYAPTVRTQVKRIDETLSAFAHGQAAVCLILATYYTIGLCIMDLNFAPVIGLLTGILAFIPFVGIILGGCMAMIVAMGQYASWEPVGMVALIFLGGQLLESNLLVPLLLGNRIGLHPVWIIFALLIGLQSAGFLGVVFALPLAAVLGVVCRFLIGLYLETPFYQRGR